MKIISSRTVLNTLIFLSAVVAIFLDYQGSSWFYFLKPITTILVILLPVLRKGENNKFRNTLIAALCFCVIGDILLLKSDFFVYGLGTFLIGHLLFSKGFIYLEGFQKNIAIALVLLLVGIGIYIWLYKDLGVLKYPVAAYVLVILFMVWQGVSLYLDNKKTSYALIALGALLFMFSDALIAINKFKNPFELSGMLILSTYWLAITLIANGSSMHSKRI